MPRTAKTLAITHDGQEILLAGKLVSLLDQKESLKEFRLNRHHAKYREVSYQESDGPEQVFRLMTPEAHEERQAQIKKDNDAQAEFAKKQATPVAPETKPDTLPVLNEEAEEAAADGKNEFQDVELKKLDRESLLAIADKLLKAGRLTAMPGGSKSKLITAILSAPPVAPETKPKNRKSKNHLNANCSKNMKPKTDHNRSKAFSLIQTLIVIAIIGIFAALLMAPAECQAGSQQLIASGTVSNANWMIANSTVNYRLPGGTNITDPPAPQFTAADNDRVALSMLMNLTATNKTTETFSLVCGVDNKTWYVPSTVGLTVSTFSQTTDNTDYGTNFFAVGTNMLTGGWPLWAITSSTHSAASGVRTNATGIAFTKPGGL